MTATNGAELVHLPALEQARLVRAREVSPVELVEAYLDRIDRYDPGLNSYLTVAHDHARVAAKEAEQAVTAGEQLGPLHGVPISIKDLTDTAGIRTTMGTAAYHDRVPEEDASIVTSLRAAGCIVLGKTNTPEFGIGSTDPIAYGPCRNPWDRDRTVRGSSGGAGAAMAASLCALAHGTDGGGSVRLPAATCGTVGLKPSRGRISTHPAASSLFVQPGPLSRSVGDAAAFLDATAGYVTGDAFWAPVPSRPFVDEVGADPGRLRIAVVTEEAGATPHPDYEAAVWGTADVLAQLGHEVVDGDIPFPDEEYVERFVWAFSARIGAREDLPELDTLDPIIRDLVLAARQVPLAGFLRAEEEAAKLARRVVASFGDFDVLVTPTVLAPPRRVDDLRDAEGRPSSDEGIGPFCFLWNVTGQPAITLPLHQDGEGLPIGIQLVGPPQDDAMVFRLAGQLEQALPWADRLPALDPRS
ncbi:MAG TPA: amidase [Nitriliruptorales bacterium]